MDLTMAYEAALRLIASSSQQPGFHLSQGYFCHQQQQQQLSDQFKVCLLPQYNLSYFIKQLSQNTNLLNVLASSTKNYHAETAAKLSYEPVPVTNVEPLNFTKNCQDFNDDNSQLSMSSFSCSDDSCETDEHDKQTAHSGSKNKKARKRDQNRRAAFNYRKKKMQEKNKLCEEEMKLVYAKVCLQGYAEKLEESINSILNESTLKILHNDNKSVYFLCPVCIHSFDNITNLRIHLNNIHNTFLAVA